MSEIDEGFYVRAATGDTVDYICHQHYGENKDITEQVISHSENKHLENPILTAGDIVYLPKIIVAKKVARTVRLWG